MLPPPAAVASKLSKMSPSPSNASKKSVTSELAAVDELCSVLKLAIASSKLSSKTVVSLESLASLASRSGVIFTFWFAGIDKVSPCTSSCKDDFIAVTTKSPTVIMSPMFNARIEPSSSTTPAEP